MAGANGGVWLLAFRTCSSSQQLAAMQRRWLLTAAVRTRTPGSKAAATQHLTPRFQTPSLPPSPRMSLPQHKHTALPPPPPVAAAVTATTAS